MRMTFDLHKFNFHQVTPEKICDEVMMVGFSAELLEMIENDQAELLKNNKDAKGQSGLSNS